MEIHNGPRSMARRLYEKLVSLVKQELRKGMGHRLSYSSYNGTV